MMQPTSPLVVIVGAGPGLGTALASRFADGGCSLALLSRSAESRAPAMEKLKNDGHTGHTARGYDCDAGEPERVTATFKQIRSAQGDPSVLIYNAGVFVQSGILELDPARFESAWRINCCGAFLAIREVLPAMCDAGSGTILFTGATAALRGGARFAGLAVGKFGLRALAQSTAREFGPRGIHVAHVVIDGQIDTPTAHERDPSRAEGTLVEPEAIAENYWNLYQQPGSAWTLETDLRPYLEKL